MPNVNFSAAFDSWVEWLGQAQSQIQHGPWWVWALLAALAIAFIIERNTRRVRMF